MTDRLDLTSYEKALDSLTEILAQPKGAITRDATIQRFEYTFELAWKMMKRHLDWSGHSDTAALSRKELFREAALAGLISEPENWFAYNRARNNTYHAYSLSLAEEVYEAAQAFVADARELLAALHRHHD